MRRGRRIRCASSFTIAIHEAYILLQDKEPDVPIAEPTTSGGSSSSSNNHAPNVFALVERFTFRPHMSERELPNGGPPSLPPVARSYKIHARFTTKVPPLHRRTCNPPPHHPPTTTKTTMIKLIAVLSVLASAAFAQSSVRGYPFFLGLNHIP